MSESASSGRGLLGVRTFFIQKAVLDETIDFLTEVGSERYEGFVLWGGQALGKDSFRFTAAIVPEQRAMVTGSGLLVFVEGEALFKVNKALHEHQEILAGQVHTHPTSAYHSSTDDHYPLVTLLGSLSLVIPDFARNAPDDIDAWAWYRLAAYGRWKPLDRDTKVTFE